ncbi:hypothetical protein PoB_004780700 [Plakobranchus ocellatus]|uniref:Uncharacterized protein n=1 Tax=Plakobranchus ocellatus TaxID=259542 RepID=A0AAV4BQQ3_9GAST|nr:hypothetical protein PoB_004780700 [Plakobranchus ocellatus]
MPSLWTFPSHSPFVMGETVRVKRGVSGTGVSESALRSAGTLLSRVQAPPPAPWPDKGSENLRSSSCGLAIYKTNWPLEYLVGCFNIDALDGKIAKSLVMTNCKSREKEGRRKNPKWSTLDASVEKRW